MAETEFLILPPKCFSIQAGSVDSSFFSLQFRSNPQAMPTGATVFSPPHCHRSSPGCSGLLTGRSLPPGACDNLTCSFLPSLPNPRISPIEEKQGVTFKIQNQSCRPPWRLSPWNPTVKIQALLEATRPYVGLTLFSLTSGAFPDPRIKINNPATCRTPPQ